MRPSDERVSALEDSSYYNTYNWVGVVSLRMNIKVLIAEGSLSGQG